MKNEDALPNIEGKQLRLLVHEHRFGVTIKEFYTNRDWYSINENEEFDEDHQRLCKELGIDYDHTRPGETLDVYPIDLENIKTIN